MTNSSGSAPDARLLLPPPQLPPAPSLLFSAPRSLRFTGAPCPSTSPTPASPPYRLATPSTATTLRILPPSPAQAVHSLLFAVWPHRLRFVSCSFVRVFGFVVPVLCASSFRPCPFLCFRCWTPYVFDGLCHPVLKMCFPPLFPRCAGCMTCNLLFLLTGSEW